MNHINRWKPQLEGQNVIVMARQKMLQVNGMSKGKGKGKGKVKLSLCLTKYHAMKMYPLHN
jgi:hypothetical protein